MLRPLIATPYGALRSFQALATCLLTLESTSSQACPACGLAGLRCTRMAVHTPKRAAECPLITDRAASVCLQIEVQVVPAGAIATS